LFNSIFSNSFPIPCPCHSLKRVIKIALGSVWVNLFELIY
jgi:hypothetical protein